MFIRALGTNCCFSDSVVGDVDDMSEKRSESDRPSRTELCFNGGIMILFKRKCYSSNLLGCVDMALIA